MGLQSDLAMVVAGIARSEWALRGRVGSGGLGLMLVVRGKGCGGCAKNSCVVMYVMIELKERIYQVNIQITSHTKPPTDVFTPVFSFLRLQPLSRICTRNRGPACINISFLSSNSPTRLPSFPRDGSSDRIVLRQAR
jgi:hypothetical protein